MLSTNNFERYSGGLAGIIFLSGDLPAADSKNRKGKHLTLFRLMDGLEEIRVNDLCETPLI